MSGSLIESCKLCGAASAVPGFILAPSGPIPCRSGIHPDTEPNFNIKRDGATASAIGDDIAKQVADGIASGQTYMPDVVYGAAAKSGIVTERRRVIETIDRMSAQVSEALIVSFALARQGQPEAAGIAKMHETTLKTLEAARKEIQRDPDSCKACGGSKRVASKLAVGQTVACSACAPAAALVS